MTLVRDSPAPAAVIPATPQTLRELPRGTKLKLRDRMLNKSLPHRTRKASQRMLNKSLRANNQQQINLALNPGVEDKVKNLEVVYQKLRREMARIDNMLANVRDIFAVYEKAEATPMMMKSMVEQPRQQGSRRADRSLPLKLQTKKPVRSANDTFGEIWDRGPRLPEGRVNSTSAMIYQPLSFHQLIDGQPAVEYQQNPGDNSSLLDVNPESSSILDVNQPDWNVKPTATEENLAQVEMTLVSDEESDDDLGYLEVDQMNLDLLS